jgi:hypothetical protein
MKPLPPFSEKAKRLKTGIYEHMKGMRYQVLSVARHSETLEELVVYKQLYGTGDVWVRPLSMFLETVNGVPRFRLIESS